MPLKLVERSLVKNIANYPLADTLRDEELDGMIEQASYEVEEICRREFNYKVAHVQFHQSYEQNIADPVPQFLWLEKFPVVTTADDPYPYVAVNEAVMVEDSTHVTLKKTPNPVSSLRLVKNSTDLTAGVDYTIVAGTMDVELSDALVNGDVIRANYTAKDPRVVPPEVVWAPNEFHDTMGVTLTPGVYGDHTRMPDYAIDEKRGCITVRRASGLMNGVLPLYLGKLIFAYAPKGFRITYTGGYPVTQEPTDANYVFDPLDEFGITQVPRGLKTIVARHVANLWKPDASTKSTTRGMSIRGQSQGTPVILASRTTWTDDELRALIPFTRKNMM